MKILVCLKQVAHKDARLEVRPDGTWVKDENVKFEINDYDSYALELALRLRDAATSTPKEVVVVSVGPERVSQSLRHALGMGADRAIHIWDPALASADSSAIAKAIAAVAAGQGFSLIVTGLMSDDGNFAITGPMLAHLLDIPHVTAVVKAELKGNALEVERELEAGALEVRSVPLPALLAVQTGICDVRYPNLKGIMAAKKKPLEKKALSDLGLDAAKVAPKVRIEKIYTPPKGEGAELVKGSAAEQATQVVAKIKELGLL